MQIHNILFVVSLSKDEQIAVSDLRLVTLM